MKQLEVKIMGQGYLLGCPEGGEERLQQIRPGIITFSGTSAPSGTISSTCATAVFDAMHITGPKLRSALRNMRLPHGSAQRAFTKATSPCNGFSST